MKRRGFTLIEVIVAMCLLGMVSVFTCTTLSMTVSEFNKIRCRNEMNYIGEMVIEKLKTEDAYVKEVLEKVDELGQTNFVDEGFDSDKYIVTIFKDYGSNKLLEISVKILHNYQEKEPIYVDFKAAIPR
ncbi:MAG: type II secretion system protein [Tissierellia bacterium]|nr:type II secretion system protein [Tissierellia bacterium]